MAPRKNTSGRRVPLIAGAIAAAALTLFLLGELVSWSLSDPGRLAWWRWAHVGERAHAVRIIGHHIEQGLEGVGIARDAIESTPLEGDGPSLGWSVALPPDGSLLLANYCVTRAVEDGGAQVLSAKESRDDAGRSRVHMVLGVSGRPTHDLTLVRTKRDAEAPRTARVALLLFSSTEDDARLEAVCARSEVFSVGTPGGQDRAPRSLAAARRAGREVVLFMPMEPENYPRVNPGPATLLVSMGSRQVEQGLRRALDESGEVVGVANLFGSFATQDEPFMEAFLRELKRTPLTFLHVSPAPRSIARRVASRIGAAYDQPDALIDESAKRGDRERLDDEWDAALQRAKRRGQAIVLLRITESSAAWLDRALAEKRLTDVRLVPLSTVLHRPATRD
jgi:polysaccharide deacetylase 2 family uncharacterized protein YibQ